MANSPTTHLTVARLEDRLTPTSSAIVATGAGAGGLPLVQVYRADGSIRSEFMAYDESFRGGVTVAVADVNGDGVMDVITAAGAGGGPHVKVFDGKSVEKLFDPTQPHAAVEIQLTELYSFFAYNSNFRGGVSVASGDVDADGYADIVTGAGAGGGPHVKVFSGKTGAEIRSFFAFDAGFRGGVNVAVGELQEGLTDGRQHADILVGSGAGMKATVLGFNGKTGDPFFSLSPYGNFSGGVYVAAGDMTKDGFDDVITGAGAGGGPHVTVYDGYILGHLATIQLVPGGPQPIHSYFAYDVGFRGGVRVAASDLNGDQVADIVTSAGPGGGPHVKAFSGQDRKELFSRFKYGVATNSPVFAAGSSIAAPYTPPQPPASPPPPPGTPA